MEKYVYIKKSIAKHFVDFAEPLSSDEYNNLGETWLDYEDNKWVLLSDELASFYEDHPTATVKEVFDMEIVQSEPDPEIELERAKDKKIEEISEYDNSYAVNSFIIQFGETEIEAWIDRETRADYKNSLDAAELLNMTEVTPVFNGVSVTIPVQTAKIALAQILLYANKCYNITEQHKASVRALNTVEAVNNYNYIIGYPERPVFDLSNE